jgi:hypothetical protein
LLRQLGSLSGYKHHRLSQLAGVFEKWRKLMKSSKCALLALAAVLVLGLAEGLGAGDGPTTTTTLAEVSNQGNFPAVLQKGFRYWSNGDLVTIDFPPFMVPDKPGVILYDRYGAVARQPIVWLEDSRSLSVSDVAVSRSGNLVVGGGATNNEGAIANFIAEIGNDDRVHRVVRTTPFVPTYVCALDDGTVWAYGFQRDASIQTMESSPRLRQYSFDKGLLQAMLVTAALPDGEVFRQTWLAAQGKYLGALNLRCNSKMVVLYNAGTGDLVEYDLGKHKMTVSKVAALPADIRHFRITGFALTDSGEMFASFYDTANMKVPVSGLFHLERDSASSGYKWVAVPGTVGAYLKDSPIQKLWGADGDQLVFSRLKDGRLYWTK